jgi:uncharacterized damage-inducible protein DinB
MNHAAGRVDPPLAGSEEETLLGFLDYHRDTLMTKIDGLSQDELGRTHPPTTMTLAGLVKHLAYVEDGWFDETFAGNPVPSPWNQVDWSDDPDWEWHSAVDDDPETLRAIWNTSVARSKAAVSAAESLAQPSKQTGREGRPFSLRWILCHMIEEYARHNGHADLLREAIDGSTGE